MSDLIVLGFENEPEADSFIAKLQSMQKEHILSLQDLVKVTVDAEGKPKIKQSNNLAATGALSGAFWGMLIGLIFLMPLVGMAAGALGGAFGGSMSDYGIDDDFIKGMAGKIKPGQAALFLLVNESTPDKVAEEIAGTKAEVLKTNLSNDAETRLRDAFQG